MTNTYTAQEGDKVVLHYKGTLDDGTEFDNSHERGEPMKVILGNGHLIDGFDEAIRGVSDGETKSFTLTPDEAYGDRDDDAVTTLEKSMFPDDFEFTEGMTIPLSNEEGRNFMTTLIEEGDSDVTVDFNHPLAGKNLTFEVEVISVVPKESLPKIILPDGKATL